MNANKQLINLVGIVLVVAVLVAGVALIAMPMWTQAQAADQQTRTVAQSNVIYETQIMQLSSVDVDELDAQLAALRTGIPSSTQFDEAFEIVIGAAESLELTLESVKISTPETWTPRTGADADSSSDDAEDAESLQRQAAITIRVPVADAETVTKFVDALGVGPRLLSPTFVSYSDGVLEVTALTFIRTED